MNGKIYCITNLVDGKFYIGQTIQTIRKRFSRHKYDSKTMTGHLHLAMKKYGTDNFVIDCLVDGIETTDELNYAEKLWIAITNCCDKAIGYNKHEGGNKPPIGVKKTSFQKGHDGKYMKGRIVTEEVRKKISDAQKGITRPWMIGRNTWSKGRNISSVIKDKISKSLKGKNTWTLGNIWITNGIIEKNIKPKDLEKYIGFRKGRLNKLVH